MTGREVGADALPDFEARGPWRRNAVDAQEADGTQNKGHYRGFQLRSACQPHACDVAAVAGRACQPGQRFATHVVDGASELRTLERTRAVIDALTQQHLRSTDREQITFGVLLA